MTFKKNSVSSGTVFANLAWYRRTKDLVPFFGSKVHLFENSLLKIQAQLYWSHNPLADDRDKMCLRRGGGRRGGGVCN